MALRRWQIMKLSGGDLLLGIANRATWWFSSWLIPAR
jgi:hypothetical protein